MAGKRISSQLNSWEQTQLKRAILLGLKSLGLSADRLWRAYGWRAYWKLSPWCSVLAELAVRYDKGGWDFRRLRQKEDALVEDFILMACGNGHHEPLIERRDDGYDHLVERFYPGDLPLQQRQGAWWSGPCGAYAERWQAVGIGWAYSLATWHDPTDFIAALDGRGFPRMNGGTGNG
jgi:hypothetical protein